MTRDELLRELAASRRQLLESIRGLAVEQLAGPGVMEGWSAKDLLAHLTGWEAELIKALAQGRSGKRPAYVDLTPADEDSLNEKWRKEFRRKPLDKVLEDLDAVRQQLVRQVEKLSDEELNDSVRFAWTKGETLSALLRDGTFEHEREHAAQISDWRKRVANGE